MSRKMNDRDWAHYLELKARYRDVQKKLDAKTVGKRIFHNYLLSSWAVGLVAMILMYYFFGWKILLETILGWTMGVGIIATFFAALPRLRKYLK